MTTAELIKKREEEKNKPSVAQQSDALKQQVNAAYDSGLKPTEDNTLAGNPNGISLYEVGRVNSSTGVAKAEQSVKNPSPINTPEMEAFRNQVIGVRDFGLETPEQAAARERRDYIKQGLTGLTEGLSSLANLYYTTKWAPNQKIVSQMPVLQQQLYRERLERDKKLENFRAWQRAKTDKDADRAYQEALFDKKQEAANKAAERKAKIDAQAAEIKYMRDLGLIGARKAADLEKQKGKANLDKELEGIRQKNRVAIASMNNTSAMERAKVRGGGDKTGSGKLLRIQRNNGEPMVFRKDDLDNATNLAYIYSSLPDEYKVRDTSSVGEYVEGKDGEKQLVYPISNNPTKYEMQVAIGRALQAGAVEEIAEDIQVGGSSTTQPNAKQAGEKTNPWDESNNYEVWGGNTSELANWGKENPAQAAPSDYKSPAPPEGLGTQSYVPKKPNKFDEFFKEVQDKRDYQVAVETKKKEKAIQEKKDELNNVTSQIEQYNKELEELNSMEIPNADVEIKKRGLTGDDMRRMKELVRETVDKKKFLKDQLKELQAKQKRLNKELGNG